MVLIAIHKESGKLINVENIDYTESIKRKFTYWCTCCNNELIYVNGYTRTRTRNEKEEIVSSFFRHLDGENNECDTGINGENMNNRNYLKYLSKFVDKWINNIKSEYKYCKRIGNVIDIVNKTNDDIYVKYSLVSLTNIKNKSNKNGRVIWLLSINSEKYNPDDIHPRQCTIYKINQSKKLLIHCNNKTDLVDYNLGKCEVYLDDGFNIYKLLNNTRSKTYYDANGNNIDGHIIKRININQFIKNVLDDIMINIPKFDKHNEYCLIYTKEEIKKKETINNIMKQLKILNKTGHNIDNYNVENVDQMEIDDLLIMYENITEKIKNIKERKIKNEPIKKIKILLRTLSDIESKLCEEYKTNMLSWRPNILNIDINNLHKESIDYINFKIGELNNEIYRKQLLEEILSNKYTHDINGISKKNATKLNNYISKINKEKLMQIPLSLNPKIVKYEPIKEIKYIVQSDKEKLSLSALLELPSNNKIQLLDHTENKINNRSIKDELLYEICYKIKITKVIPDIDIDTMDETQLKRVLQKLNEIIIKSTKSNY